MTYEGVLKYTEESVKQCRELASFLKKRQIAEAEYARTLLKISQKAPPLPNLSPSFYRSPSSSSANVAGGIGGDRTDGNHKAQLLKTSLWKSYYEMLDETQKLAESHNELAINLQLNVIDPFQNYIREMETIRKLQVEKGQEFVKNLQDAYAGLKKVKKEYDNLQSMSNEAVNNHIKAQQNPSTRDRELEKLTNKMQTAIEKARRAEETLQICEDICNNAKEDYFGTFLPGLYEDIRLREEERCIAVKRVLMDFLDLEKVQSQICASSFVTLSERVSDIDISEDSEDFITQEETTLVETPAKSLVDPIHCGMVFLKRGDLVGTWKEKYAVLTNDRSLYIYSNRESVRPTYVIPLQDAAVAAIDDSLYGRTNCIQVVQSTNSGRQIFNICTQTENERDRWLQALRDFCYCCPKCAAVYGYSTENFCNMHLLDRTNGFRLIRSLNLSIMEAKDLPYLSGVRTINPYCMVLFDDIKQAKTSMKLGENPFWGETFTFDDIRPHHNRVRIYLFYHNRIQRDADVGYVSIHLDQIKSSKRVEEWYAIRPTSRSYSEEVGSCGSIRIAFTFREEHLLPTAQYEPFLNLVTEPKFHAFKHLGKLVVTDREVLGKTVIRCLFGLGREVEGIKTLLESDIQTTDDPNIIFRGNSLATKALDQYMKIIAMPYLHATVGGLLRAISSMNESCEVDPLRVESPEREKANFTKLSHYASTLWNAIQKSADQCPKQLLEVFAFIRGTISEKWGNNNDNNARYSGVSGFLFLRFFCPAILSPKLFNITNELPSQAATRTLTLLAKIIQNLANLSEFGNKEPYMVQFNPFIQSQLPVMKAFIDRISTVSPQNPIFTDLRIDTRRETEALYQLFNQYLGDIITSNMGGNVDELVNILKELQAAHKRYDGDERPDGIRSGGASAFNTPRRPTMPVLPPKSSDTGSGPSSPPSSVYASPVVSALPPKIELVLDEGNPAQVSLTPPQTLSPAQSPIAYRKHREVSIYGRMTNKNSSFDNLEQLLNSISSDVGSKPKESKPESDFLGAGLWNRRDDGKKQHQQHPPITVRVTDDSEISPTSGTVSPKYSENYDSPKSAWSSTESLTDLASSPATSANPSNGIRPRPPPRGSSNIVIEKPSSTRSDNATPPQRGGTSLFRSIVSAVGAQSTSSSSSNSPVESRASPAGSLHSLHSDSSNPDDFDMNPSHAPFPDSTSYSQTQHYGSVVSHVENEDTFSDRSSIKSMESQRSDGKSGSGATRRQSVAGAAAARIKHRLSMLVQGGASNSSNLTNPSSTSGTSRSNQNQRRRAPSPMMEEKE
ncbi:Ras GTPase-activating protein 1 [Phlyctochytrium planicorne]|nr:Ras GTPase-activating protein 1 [Phlyctochytrium planicorne]